MNLVNLYSLQLVIRSDLFCRCVIRLCKYDKNIQVLPIPTRCDMLVLLSSQTGNGEEVSFWIH